MILEASGGRIRLTPSGGDDWNPIWSWDGSELLYKSHTGTGTVRRRPDPTAPATPMENLRRNVTDWSRDRLKVLTTLGSSSGDIYFLAEDGSMMAADVVTSGGSVSAGRPRALFRIPVNDITIDWFTPYDVTADGQRFLLNISDRPEPLLFLQGLDQILATKR